MFTLRYTASAILTGFAVLSAPGAAGAQAVPVPSTWEGEIVGRVYDASFRVPVTISIRPALPEEANPFHLSITAGNPNAVGHMMLVSAQRWLTPQTARQVTLTYFQVRANGSAVQARMTQDHRGTGTSWVNGFTSRNVSADHAPPVAQFMYTDPTELFVFRSGALVEFQVSGSQLSGVVRGSGASVIGIFPLPDVIYDGRLQARRTR